AELARQHRALHIAARQRRDRRVRAAGLDLVEADLPGRIVAEGGAVEPPAAAGKRRAVEFAEGDVVGDAHAADTGVLQRLFGQKRHLVPAHLLAAGAVGIARDADFAALGLALAGQHLDELALAVAGDARDADDLAAAHRERDIVDRDRAGIVQRADLR